MRWQDKLTREQRRHCNEWTGRTLIAIQRTADYQAGVEARVPGYHCCYECSQIFGLLDIIGKSDNA